MQHCAEMGQGFAWKSESCWFKPLLSFQPGLLTLPLYEAVGEPCVKKSNDKKL